jgi:hypothetical protein
MAKLKHGFPRATLTWADHFSDFEDGYSIEDIEKMMKKPAIRETSGYLVGENKRMVALAGTIEEDGTCSEIFLCMRKCILDMEVEERKQD